MALTYSDGLRNFILDQSMDEYNGGTLEIRTGAPPGPNAAETGTVLASIALPTPAFGAAAAGSKAKTGTWQDPSADTGGIAGHFRIRKSGDAGGANANARREEGTITGTGGGGDMELQNTNIQAGQTITITGYTKTQPAS